MRIERIKKSLTKPNGIILPSLILLSFILILLLSILFSMGTANLRFESRATQAAQASFAAETGLVRIADEFARGVISEAEMKKGSKEGTLAEGELRYSVSWQQNAGDKEIQAQDSNIKIPPQTTYVKSVGTTEDGRVRESIGALFTLGAGSFRAGVVANKINASGSAFMAYSSLDADNLTREEITPLSGRGILTTTTPAPGGYQFDFDESSKVYGNVYTAKGTAPGAQVRGADRVTNYGGYVGVLDKEIAIPEIKVPKINRGNGDSDDTGEPNDGEQVQLGNSDCHFTITWDSSQLRWTVKHHETVMGYFKNIDSGQLVFEQNPSYTRNDKIVSVNPNGTINIKHRDKPTQNIPFPAPAPPSSLNPDTVESGSYSKVEVNSGESKIKGGTVIVTKTLELNGGKLKLDDAGDGGPVTIYVTGSLKIDGLDSIVNTTKEPPRLKIYYTGSEKITITGGSKAYFTLIAPKADIELIGDEPETVTPAPDGEAGELPPEGDPAVDPTPAPADPESLEPTYTTNFYGAFVGRNVVVKNANFYFDVATDGVGEGSDSNVFRLLRRFRISES